MNDEQIDHIIAHRRKKLGWKELSDYLSLLPGFAFISMACAIIVYSSQEELTAGIVSLSVALIVVGILLIWFVLIRLRQNVSYTFVTTSVTSQENMTQIETILKNESYEYTIYPSYIIAYTKISLTSFGETLTFIPLDNAILINSHPTFFQPLTFYKDSRNIKKLRSEIEKFNS